MMMTRDMGNWQQMRKAREELIMSLGKKSTAARAVSTRSGRTDGQAVRLITGRPAVRLLKAREA
jgi:hypothetical protein